jgi:hypothetical protein
VLEKVKQFCDPNTFQINFSSSFACFVVLLGQGVSIEAKWEFSDFAGSAFHVDGPELALAVVASNPTRSTQLHTRDEGFFPVSSVLSPQICSVHVATSHK